MKVFTCTPRGYCSGVINAISLALKQRKEHPNSKIYVYGKLVHNEDVIRLLDENGIITLNYINNYALLFKGLEKGSFLIFTAHGHLADYEKAALDAHLIIVDATCPRVKENIDFIKKSIVEGKEIIYIGKALHPETIAALSISDKVYLFEHNSSFDYSKIKTNNPIVLNQTTLSFLDIKLEHEQILKHLPQAIIKNDICNATYLRQEAVYNIPKEVDLIIIVGGSSSSNTQRLVDIAKSNFPHVEVKRILNIDDIKSTDLTKFKYAAVAAGTSTPLEKTNEVIKYLKELD